MNAPPPSVLLLGTIVGFTYGLLAVGLVLIYRSNRIINFAHGQIGAFGAAVLGVAVINWHVPYWLAFPFAMLISAAVAVAAESGVVRRLRNAPRVMSIVATLGVGQLLVLLAYVISDQAASGASFPRPSYLPEFDVGALRITAAYSGMLFLSPVLVLAIGLFLKRSRYGLAIRAAADNPAAARMAGIFPGRMSSLSWGLAGALSAFTAILTQPTRGVTSPETFGPDLLLRAVAAAVLGRMQSLPVAMGAGIGLGVLEQVLLWNHPQSGLVDAALFAVILVALMFQRRREGRIEEKEEWSTLQATRRLPAGLKSVWLVRNLGLVTGTAGLAGLAALPAVLSHSDSAVITTMLALAIVGLSVSILTGLAGQLTLGPFAVAAIGAVASYQVASRTGNFLLALLCAGMAAGVVSVLLGLPAVRLRGLMLTVTTLGFAIATPAWLLGQRWMLGEGKTPGRPIVGGLALDTGHSYFYFALAVFAIALLLARNVHRGGFSRLLIATRDNEDNARAFAIRTILVKSQAYLVAGFLAGLGGAVYGHSLSSIGVATFPAELGIDVVVLTVLGGVSTLAGPLLGAVYVVGIPEFGPRLLPFGNIGLAATQMGALMFILWKPAGLVQLTEPVRWRLTHWIARLRGVDAARPDPGNAPQAEKVLPAAASALVARSRSDDGKNPQRAGVEGGLLRADGLRKHFGGVAAVADVSLSVGPGEVLGLIGPNGAGKTTTFELLGGFTRPDEGRVQFGGRDITRLGPAARARLGLIRSFQDAALFPTLTVTESVMVALERGRPTRLVPSLCGWTRSERAKERQAREIVGWMGLGRYRDTPIRALSTGSRRITELACLVALDPTLLLLDEPSSGVAQRDSEALGQLLLELRRELGVTMIVIEHDIPMIMGISDRIVAMAEGRVISEGTPTEVRQDPVVVDAYLGTNAIAVERSGAVPSAR